MIKKGGVGIRWLESDPLLTSGVTLREETSLFSRSIRV